MSPQIYKLQFNSEGNSVGKLGLALITWSIPFWKMVMLELYSLLLFCHGTYNTVFLPLEDPATRRHPGRSPHHIPNLPAPWQWTFQPREMWKKWILFLQIFQPQLPWYDNTKWTRTEPRMALQTLITGKACGFILKLISRSFCAPEFCAPANDRAKTNLTYLSTHPCS